MQQLDLGIPTWACLLFMTGWHRPVATRATVWAAICCTAGSSEGCGSWLGFRLHYHHSVKRDQLCETRAALNSLGWIFHILFYRLPNFYSALKMCNGETPGVWLVLESWRTKAVSQRGFLLERIRLISLSHWFPQDACYQCLNSFLKAEVVFKDQKLERVFLSLLAVLSSHGCLQKESKSTSCKGKKLFQ